MGGRLPLLNVLVFFFLTVLGHELVISHASTTVAVRCQASERKALVEFKNGLRDPSNRLSSWVGEDCCSWEGVQCSNNITGRHVTKLDLRNRRRLFLYPDCSIDEDVLYSMVNASYGCKWALQGDISPSLLALQHLHHLDLSGNYFHHQHIPEFLGSLKRLTYLNLSGAGFSGTVPHHQLRNLSSTLQYLDLSYNYYFVDDESIYLYVEDAGWISGLTSLRHLNLNGVRFRNASNWLQALNALPSIRVVELSDCGLLDFPSSLSHVNFTSLTTLDLSYNYINSSVPDWLFNITTLEHLDLGDNDLIYWRLNFTSIAKLTSLRTLDLSGQVFLNNGFLPAALSNLCKLQSLILDDVSINDAFSNLEVAFSSGSCLTFSLQELDLGNARLSGSLPDWLGNIKHLKYLYLSSNSLYGAVPDSLRNLKLLQHLDLSDNYLNGTVTEGIGQMKDLVYLDLSNNSLSLSEVHLANLSSLKYLGISDNSLAFKEDSHGRSWNPPFQLLELFMYNCQMGSEPHFPEWLQSQRSLYMLSLGGVGIKDTIPNWLPSTLRFLFLSNNEITGEVPLQHFPNMIYLDLSNNSFSGHLPPIISSTIRSVDLHMNNLNGSIPWSFCQIQEILRLSKNYFSGEIPNCWKNSSKLFMLDFSSNNFIGEIPNSLCNLRSLQVLHLSHNNFFGKIPGCLKSCTELVTLDLGHNHFTGNVPTWIGENLLNLKTLSLRSNAFTGHLPQLSHLQFLQILDLSNNKFSGIISQSFGNFSALMEVSPPYGSYLNSTSDNDDMWLFIKGNELEYNSILPYVKVIDLSNNELSGFIPDELGNLHGLQSLNLSGNYLIGEIPKSIGGIQQLQALDLSRNNLSGSIPSSLAALNFLSILNLSYNNLSGKIPTGNQLQTLMDPSNYAGNPNLCGFPLTKNCTEEGATTKGNRGEQNEDTESKIETVWLYTSIALGFIMGFWTICGTILLHKRWRISYFRVIDSMYDKLYVMIAVNIKRFKRQILATGQDD